MDTTDIENKILARLEERIKDLAIEGFPDDPDTYTLSHPNGAILLHYGGSGYEKPDTYNIIIQAQEMQWPMTIVARSLRDHTGIYAYLSAVKAALTGYRVPGYTKLYMVDDRYLGRVNDTHQHGVTVALRGTHEEEEQDP